MGSFRRYFRKAGAESLRFALGATLIASGAAMLAAPAAAEEEDEAEWAESLNEPYRLAVAGEYDAALRAFEQVRAESPDDIQSLDALRFAVAYAASGDKEGHLAHSRWLVSRYPSPELASDADRSIKGYIVSAWAEDPALLEEATTRMRFATDKAVEHGEGEWMAWFYASRGIAEYRTGDYEAASQWLSQAIGDENPYIRSLALNFYVMAEHAQGNEENAAVLLREASRVVGELPDRGTEDYEENWSDTLVARMSLQEATEKVAGVGAGAES